MRIALLTSTGEQCGIARYSRDLHAALAPLVDADLIPIDPWPPEGERLERLRAADLVHLQHEYSFWGTAFPPPRAYYEGLERFRRPGRLVMTAHTVADAEAVVAAHGIGLKPLVKRLALRLRPGLRQEIDTRPFLAADRVIVHSTGAAAALAKRLERPDLVQCWPMPIQDWSAPAADWEALSARLELDRRRLVTIFGFVTPEKGCEMAIEAIAHLSRQHPNVALVIAGGARTQDGEQYLSELREISQAPALAPWVRFTGYLSDAEARALLEHSEIALLPYRSATGSYAAGAALAAGCPLLTSDLPAFAPPLPALRFHRDAVTDLEEKLDRLLADPALRADLTRRSRQYATENNWLQAAERHVALYLEDQELVRRVA
jgi:glycosyltransferase involved in cell wall biosynthesis